MRITKGIIVAAGYGTRFLPVTKSVPKELLPIIDRPALDFIIDEFIAAGLTDILIIISPHKRLIARHYAPLPWLERFLRLKSQPDLLRKISPPNIAIRFAIQRQMRGTGHALLHARRFAGRDTVIVAYPDDLHIGSPPLSTQLIDLHRARGASVLATIKISRGHERYGIVDIGDGGLVRGITEKPAAGRAASDYASIGRFLLTAQFFDYLAEGWAHFKNGRSSRDGRGGKGGKNGRGNEYYHTYALDKLIAQRQLIYHPIQGLRLDIGEPQGYVEAIARYNTWRNNSQPE